MEMNAIVKSIMGGKKEVADMTPDQLADFYMKQAMGFESSQFEDMKKSKKLAWTCFAGAMVLCGVTIVASSITVFKNKPNPPGIMQVHDNGDITWLKTLADAKVTYNKATDVSYLKKYIVYRESYDWEQIQDFYDSTMLLSNPTEGNLYATFNSEANPNAPVNVLKDKYRVIPSPGTISWVGDTALVSWSRKTINLVDPTVKPVVEYFVSTITFKYQDQPMDDRERGVNVAGFKVTSYNAVRDSTKTSAVSAVTAATGKPEGTAP
jgi:type IV secretion system protein VirB8